MTSRRPGPIGSRPRATRRAVLARAAALALLAWGGTAGAAAQDASPWSAGHQSRARLIASGIAGTDVLAGVQIELTAGYKTYWRTPGESGLPPDFDWSASVNVERVDVLWPAPQRLDDAGGVAFGYAGGVVLPLRVKAKDPGQPVKLALALRYGVCKDICIPAQADLVLADAKAAVGLHGPLITRALAQVPQVRPLGGDAEPAVVGLDTGAPDAPRLTARVRAPRGAQLFVEGPDGWSFLAAPLADAPDRFAIEILERPRDPAGLVPLRLTLVAGDQAVESTASLDAAALAR